MLCVKLALSRFGFITEEDFIIETFFTKYLCFSISFSVFWMWFRIVLNDDNNFKAVTVHTVV